MSEPRSEDAMKQVRPFGAWASPISAASLAEGTVGMGDLRVAQGALWWLESRPREGGRNVVMTLAEGQAREITPAGFNVRTRIHEYGGAPFVATAQGLWFSNFADQRLWLQAPGAEPQPMTPKGLRFADAAPTPDGGLVAVREDHREPGQVRNAIVRLPPAGGAGEILFSDSDFVAYPRLSPDGRRLAWIAWDFPAMPWDETTLRVADVGPEGLSNIQVIAGGPGISVLEPQWTPEGALAWISDESGTWNLYEGLDGQDSRRFASPLEFGGPLWSLGRATYAVLGRRIVAAARATAGDVIVVIDRDSGESRSLDLPFVAYGQVQALDASGVAVIAHAAADTAALARIDVDAGTASVLHRPAPLSLAADGVSRAEPITFPSAGGRVAHAFFYAPASADFAGPPDELPPLIVQAHGGPTAAASPALSLGVQYWTSRGFAVVDVDYGGSTGYGRAYRRSLDGQWGVVDVEDVIAAARFLADTHRVDPKRIAIHGGSAGGFTVLAALARGETFAAGASFYGVADLEALARDTHKFESRYLDGLIGPWPQARALYEERSPIRRLDGFRAPLLILQGSDDPIVPRNQALMIRDALRARDVPVAFIEFAGESHGWRRAETIVRAKAAELSFYAQVFGFTPAEPIDPVEVEGLARG